MDEKLSKDLHQTKDSDMFQFKHQPIAYSIAEKTKLSSDDELLRRCREGDDDAWEQVLEKYQRLIYSIPLNFGLGSEDAADIFQQTFMSLVEHLERLRPDSNLGAWLATVARRHALHRLRKRKREQLGADGDIGESEEYQASAAVDASLRFEQVQIIDEGLNQIGRRCRDLLLALYFDPRQPSYEEIAERLNIAVGSIGPTRGRCLERLREILSEK
jgi:RNA polymerase sigma factor (sigma-70 family)